jgi:hypothetical protein
LIERAQQSYKWWRIMIPVGLDAQSPLPACCTACQERIDQAKELLHDRVLPQVILA